VNQVKIFRPKKIAVDIFDKKHELHRLTRGDVEARQGFSGVSAEDIKNIVLATGGVLTRLMELSFPTFEGWGELPIADELELFETVWAENNIPGIIANFTKLGERIATATVQK
jgi:hypothetical protein